MRVVRHFDCSQIAKSIREIIYQKLKLEHTEIINKRFFGSGLHNRVVHSTRYFSGNFFEENLTSNSLHSHKKNITHYSVHFPHICINQKQKSFNCSKVT